MDVAHHQRNRALGAFHCVAAIGRNVGDAFKAVDAELSPAGGEVGLGYLLYGQASHISIISCGDPG